MNDIIENYEEIVSNKTAYTERMEKQAQLNCGKIYFKNNCQPVPDSVARDWITIAKRIAAIDFENDTLNDCKKIKRYAIDKIDSKELIYYKVKAFQEILITVNSLLSKIDIMLNLLGLKSGDIEKNILEELRNYADKSSLEELTEESDIEELMLVCSTYNKLSDEIIKQNLRADEDNILFTQPMLQCFLAFYRVTIELGERYMAILGSVLVPTEFYFDNGLKKIYFNYKNPHFTIEYHTILNLEKEKIEPVFEGLKNYIKDEQHELLKLFLKSELIEGYIDFVGDSPMLLDTFYRLLSSHWITKHTNDTLFFLIQSKIKYYDSRKQNFIPIIDNESQRKSAIRVKNYLAEGMGVKIEGLPYRVKKNRQPIPKNSSQKK